MIWAIVLGCAVKSGLDVRQAESMYQQLRPSISERIPSHEEVLMQRNTMQAGAERMEETQAALVYDWELVELYMTKSREEYSNAKYHDAELFARKAAVLMQEIAAEQDISIDAKPVQYDSPAEPPTKKSETKNADKKDDKKESSSGNIYADPE